MSSLLEAGLFDLDDAQETLEGVDNLRGCFGVNGALSDELDITSLLSIYINKNDRD